MTASSDWQKLLAVPAQRRIYLDLDDVLAETTTRIVSLLNARFARQAAFHELRHFDLGLAFELSADEHDHAMECVHDESFLRELPVREGALEVLTSWSNDGYHLTVITGRPPGTCEISKDWLRAQRVPHDSFFCVDKYGRYDDHAERVPLDRLSALAVEDSPEIARFLAEQGAGGVLLMDRPWNRAHPALEHESAARIQRVHGWDEISRLSEPGD